MCIRNSKRLPQAEGRRTEEVHCFRKHKALVDYFSGRKIHIWFLKRFLQQISGKRREETQNTCEVMCTRIMTASVPFCKLKFDWGLDRIRIPPCLCHFSAMHRIRGTTQKRQKRLSYLL